MNETRTSRNKNPLEQLGVASSTRDEIFGTKSVYRMPTSAEIAMNETHSVRAKSIRNIKGFTTMSPQNTC